MLVSVVSEKCTVSGDLSTFKVLGGVARSSTSGLVSTSERKGSGCVS